MTGRIPSIGDSPNSPIHFPKIVSFDSKTIEKAGLFHMIERRLVLTTALTKVVEAWYTFISLMLKLTP